MPIYNAYSYLRPALDSVLDQTLREIELICVDDGSTDRSIDILKEYQERDPRVRIITENNAGPSWARNKGLSRARGEYVIFLDADDFFEPTLLASLYELAVRDELDIAITEYDIYNDRRSRFEAKIKGEHEDIFEEGKVLSQSEYPTVIFQSVTSYVWNKLYKRAFLIEKELSFHPTLRVFEDTYFVMTSLAMASRVGKNFDTLIHHRVYSAQSRNKLFRKYYYQIPELYLRIKEFLMRRGMYLPLSESFLNLSASRCYKVYNILWRDAKRDFWDSLHSPYSELLGWEKILGDEIENDDVGEFVASVMLHNHKQHQRRVARGRRTTLSEVESSVRGREQRRRFKDFWRGLFGIKA